MFSFTLIHGDGRTLPHLQYVASLAVAQGVQRVADAHYEVSAAKRPFSVILEGAFSALALAQLREVARSLSLLRRISHLFLKPSGRFWLTDDLLARSAQKLG